MNTPETATKPVATPKKRGRKGDNVAKAFVAVPTTPTAVERFSAEHSVSVHVLKQAKRFDRSNLPGQVRVKVDRQTGTQMIWRDVPTS